MKRIAIALLAAISLGAFAETVPVTGGLEWDYDPADEYRIDGYRLYADDALMHEIPDPAARGVTFSDAGLTAGTYVLHLTAYNAADESAPSNSLNAAIVDGAPPAPTLLRIQVNIQ
jgi:hypothetical protein